MIRVLICLHFMLVALIQCGKFEKKLFEKLFADYDINERPVENESDSVGVVVGMSLQQILDLDEKEQVLKCNGWMDYVRILSLLS
jgi:hypothetical protein